MYAHNFAQVDWNERLGSAVEIGAGSGQGDVYRRFQDVEGGSNSSASNDTECTTLLDESCRKNERLYDITPMDRGERHSRGSTKNKIFLFIIAFCVIFTVLMGSYPYGNDRGRVGTIAGWGLNTSRQTIDYVLPYENTTLIDPANVCTTEERAGLDDEGAKVFLLIVVCSSADNFEARQTIRETWGNVREFNYDQFRRLHQHLRGEFLDPKPSAGRGLKDYMHAPSDDDESGTNASPSANSSQDAAATDSTLSRANFNVKIVFLVGQSESAYVHQQQHPAGDGETESSGRKMGGLSDPEAAGGPSREPPLPGTTRSSLFPSGADVDPAFNFGVGVDDVADELQLRIVNESEVYGDIIQESFIDSYNNLTLKTIMMLKWVTNNCDGKESQNTHRKPYLEFSLEARDYTGDLNARMMVYVHGEEWLKQNGRPGDDVGDVVSFAVGKAGNPGGGVIDRFRGTVPDGAGRFVAFNVTQLVQEWFKEREQTAPHNGSIYVAVETLNELAQRLVVASPNGGKFVRPSLKFLMKCDDDTFINVPNLLQVLLGGTVPLYKAALSFYDNNTVMTKSLKNRLVESRHLLTGFLFCDVKPIGDTTSKWYSPAYMYDKDVYPNYLSGTAYLMNFETAKMLYRASLSTPIFHLEDVYLTGIVADRVKIRRRHHPLFFYSYTKDLCALRGMISQHQLHPGEIRTAYDYITNMSIPCKGVEKRLTFGQFRLQLRKRCQ